MKNNRFFLINVSLVIGFLLLFQFLLKDFSNILFAARSRSLLEAEMGESRRERVRKDREERRRFGILSDRLRDFESEDKSFASNLKEDLQKTYQKAERISEEANRAQIELQRKEEEKIGKARNEYEKLMLHLKKSFEEKLDDINQKSDYLSRKLTEESQRRQDIIMERAESEATLRLNKREAELLKMQARQKQQDELSKLFAPIIGVDSDSQTYDVEKWRRDVYADVRDNLDYLAPIFRVDAEFSELFNKKMDFIEHKITMTQSVGDSHYKVVEKELDLINVISDSQKKADAILESVLASMDVDLVRKNEIRFAIMQELTPMVENVVDSEHKISIDEIKKVVLESVSKAQKKPADEFRIQPDLMTVEKKLRNELQKEKTHSAKVIRRLKKALGDLNKEKINLKIEAEKAKKELFASKQINDDKLKETQQKFSALKTNLDEKSKRCVELSVLMKKYQNELSASEMNKNERDKKIAEIENYLNQTTVDYLQARVDSQRMSYLEESLEEMKGTINKLRNEKTNGARRLRKKEKEVSKLKDTLKIENRLHAFRRNILSEEKNRINKDKVAVQEKLSEIAKIKSDMEKMAREHKKNVDDLVRQQLEREMDSMKDMLQHKQSEYDTQKFKVDETQLALERAYHELGSDFQSLDEMVEKATDEMGDAKKIGIESDIDTERMREEINYKLNKMMDELRGPIRTQISDAPEEIVEVSEGDWDPDTSIIYNLPEPKW